jgi:hypothetical protein
MTNYINTLVNTYPHTEASIRAANPQTSYGSPFKPQDEYKQVFPVAKPTYDPLTHYCIEAAPQVSTKGTYEQVWSVLPLTTEQATAAQTAETLRLAQVNEQRIASLWKAAHEYEFASINGSAVGLVTLGIIQSLPKCLAIQAWTASIWTEYYTRKANGSTDMDFTTVGACPHTIPDLMTELGL